MYVIRIDIYEAKSYPIVRHEFRGKSQAEATRYFNAHMNTDSFLRECVKTGFYGNMKCNHKITKFQERIA